MKGRRSERSVVKGWIALGTSLLVIYAMLTMPFGQTLTRAQERVIDKQDSPGIRIGEPSHGELTTDAPYPGGERTVTPEKVSGAPAAPQREIEPNGTSGTATPITTPARLTANLFPNGDIDFYSFTATAGDRFYGAIMTSGSAGSSTDSQMTLIASDGTTTIEFDDDNGTFAGLSSSIAGATIPTTGTYFIKVNDFTAGTTSERSYELYARLQSAVPTPEVEANDTPATANVLPASGHVSGTRNPAAATEQDWYSMTLNAGDTVFFSLDVNPERDGTVWNGRLGVALFGDASNQILVVDDAGTGDVTPVPNNPSEAMFMTVKSAGTYFAFVDSASAAVGGPTSTYNLSVTVFPKVNEGVNCTTYTSTNVPVTIGPGTGTVSSTITVPGNPRIADIDVSIDLTHALMQDVDAHLRSPAGNDNGLFTDIGAAATGGQTQMDVTFDDEAAIPPTFTAFKGLSLKPENNSTAGTASTSGAYRLSWFDGENAGGTWTLDLRDDTAGANGGTLNGWSMTICEEPPPPACPAGFVPQTVFSTDFESGAAGFTHSGAQDEWELGLPATVATTTANPIAAFNTCNSGVNCWKTDLDNTYNASSNQDLLSPSINLAGLSAPVVVTWAQRHQVETANFDHFSVDFQQVGGATPVNLYNWIEPTPISASAGTGNPQENIGGSAGWGVFSRRADSLAGLNTEFKVHLDSDTTVQFGGVAIDDVSVTACRAVSADLAITKTDGATSVAAGGNTIYTITASNAGPDAAVGASVVDTFTGALVGGSWTCIGAGGGTCTAAGSGNINDSVNLPAGGSVTYTVNASVMAGATGSVTNTATVLSQSSDPNPGNNTASDTDTITGGGGGSCQTSTTTATQSTPTVIPDGPAVVTSTVVMSGAGTYLTDLDVTTFMTHSFSADLDVTIQSPAGTVVTLTTDNGAGNDNVFNGTLWDDDANPAGQVPYTTNNGLVTDNAYVNLTTATPLAPEEPLDAFRGENPNGTWTITVSDDLAGDGGSLDSWSIEADTLSSPPTISSPATFSQTTPTVIPDGPAVVTSTVVVSGIGNSIEEVTALTNLVHSFSADLDITLQSPAGTIVTMSTDNGAGNDNVFNGTVWTDKANPAGQVPYTTNNGLVTDHAYVNLTTATPLAPEESFGAFRGEDPNGTWTITISDDLAGDGGSLDSWSLTFTTSSCTTAASVTVTGSVLDQNGSGLAKAKVVLTDMAGVSRTVSTNRRGEFTFPDVEAGRTYTLVAASRGYNFSPIVLSVSDNMSGIVFTPDGGKAGPARR